MRYILGTLLGGSAGLSLTATVLPLAVSWAGRQEEFLVRWNLGGYAAHCVLAFAGGGWLIARLGSSRLGPLLLGGIGFVCGAALGMTVYPGDLEWAMFMAVAAGAYGAVGGLLLGLILQKPPAN